MNTRNFPVHGELRLSTDGQLLIIEGQGPANLEMVLQYQRNIQAYRDKIMHKPWASLVSLSGTPLVPPEAKVLLTEIVRQAQQMHLAATAIVFIDVEYASIVRKFWQSIYEETGVMYRFFETEKDARDWLDSILRQKNS